MLFTKYGLVVVKDPRVNQKQNDEFQDLMVRYFTKRSQQYHQGLKDIDSSPQTHFQIGLTPQYKQKFQDYKQQKMKLKPPNQAITPSGFGHGPNWRFSWKIQKTKNVIPSDFPEMKDVMTSWGEHMKKGCLAVAEMLAIGLDIEPKHFVEKMTNGGFMLSPTAVNLEKVKEGDVLVGFHRDFGMLTIHGKSRFPGLYSWLNTGQKFMVNVPQGHLLLQAGKQLQWITGGHIKAGFHQVIYSKQVSEAKQKAKKQNKPLWRISSTMFCDCQESVLLQPHPKFRTDQSVKLYPAVTAKDQLKAQLNYLIELQ